MSEPPVCKQAVRLTLPCVPASVAQARAFALDACAGWRLDCDTLALVTSELVTNAVRYSNRDIELIVTPGPNHLRVEVRDRSPELPALRRATPTERSGRGLAIIEASATRWWVHVNSDGTKTVGADLECQPTQAT